MEKKTRCNLSIRWMTITKGHCLTNVPEHVTDGFRDLGAKRITCLDPHLDRVDSVGHPEGGWPQVSLFAACVNSHCVVSRSASHAATRTYTQYSGIRTRINNHWAIFSPCLLLKHSLSDLLQLCTVQQHSVTSSAPGARHGASFMTENLVDTWDICGAVRWIWKPNDARTKNEHA